MTGHDVLLERHCPILRYHSEELYGVVAVEAMTDFYFDRGPGAPRWTILTRKGEGTIAEAKPGASLVLSSQLLAESYGGLDAIPEDSLNLHNLSYAADAAIAQQQPAYRNVIYGTVAERADGAGCWLQYWFFYTFNSKAARASKAGVHEGDWEMIQVRLDAGEVPDEVTFAQHRGGQRAPWPGTASGRDEVEMVDQRPVVYVALGSHASYMRVGRHPIEDLSLLKWWIDDVADGCGLELLEPQLRVLDHDEPPPWARWPGRWGPSRFGPFKSPTGPAKEKEKKWYRPDEFHKSVPYFVDRSAQMREESGVPRRNPNVTVQRKGPRVVISYTIPYDNDGMWTAELLLSSHEGDERAPLEEVFLVNGAVRRPQAIQVSGSSEPS